MVWIDLHIAVFSLFALFSAYKAPIFVTSLQNVPVSATHIAGCTRITLPVQESANEDEIAKVQREKKSLVDNKSTVVVGFVLILILSGLEALQTSIMKPFSFIVFVKDHYWQYSIFGNYVRTRWYIIGSISTIVG